jgi:hypothetical protein
MQWTFEMFQSTPVVVDVVHSQDNIAAEDRLNGKYAHCSVRCKWKREPTLNPTPANIFAWKIAAFLFRPLF